MAYTINLTDGTVFATVNDGTVNTSSSVTLVGKNYAGYGEFLDENFIQMLENFSNSTAPTSPLTGQIWWDKTNTLLKVYNGAIWKVISAATASSTQPTSNVTGDLWYDTVNQQLKVYTGTSFLVVGPAYSSATGTAGAIPETITDSGAVSHYVTSLYVANVRVAIFSTDSTFTAAAPVSTLFPTVYKGVTFSNATDTVMVGNVTNTGNIILTSGGVATGKVTSTGANITGYTTITGNATVGNLLTAGVVSATGNVIGANFVGNVIPPAGSNVSTTGNIIAGNVLTGGLMSSTGNITGGNILTGGLISATSTITSAANITGGNLLTGGLISATSTITTTANITGGNVLFGSGIVSGSGNIFGGYITGNGSGLTGVVAVSGAATKLLNGQSYANIASSNSNIEMAVAGTLVVTVDTATLYATNLSATGNVRAGGTGSLVGSVVNAATIGNTGSTINGTTISVSGNITASGNVSSNYLLGNAFFVTGLSPTNIYNGTSNVSVAASGNVTVGVAGTPNVATFSSTGLTVGNIFNSGGNGVGNIGSSSIYFNRLFAQATTALYADVAERFAADEVLDAGTVVELGGSAEITKSLTDLSDKVFGVISTRAAYLMNGAAGEDDTHPPVAMTGRVPVKVVGTVRKGDRLVSAGNGIARAARTGEATAFNVIGRSLVDKLTPESATIEAIVTIKN